MKLYSYIVKTDKGFAPNPFWKYCTLAHCTPNHMGIRAEKGDWIIGFTNFARHNRLLFAMKVDERLHFDNYFHDKRFSRKMPILTGTWRQRSGDNIYYLLNDKWHQIESPYHFSQSDLRKDTKYPYVFIAKRFYYFGNKAPALPTRLRKIIWNRQGCKYRHDPKLVNGFLTWLRKNYIPGKHGDPIDRDYDKNISKC